MIPRPSAVPRSGTSRPDGREIAFGDVLGRGMIPRPSAGGASSRHFRRIAYDGDRLLGTAVAGRPTVRRSRAGHGPATWRGLRQGVG